MESEPYPGAPTTPLLCPLDQETFRRVWQRVMPEERPDCPVTLSPAPALPVPAAAEEAPPESPVPALSIPEVPDRRDFTPCLGAACAPYGELLQRFIRRELGRWRTYQHLSRRSVGTISRPLAVLAAEAQKYAKRLSTAYFLISGVRYWPADQAAADVVRSLASSLRTCFREEQQAACAYLAAAEEVSDPCLRALFLELAQTAALHAQDVRKALEQL